MKRVGIVCMALLLLLSALPLTGRAAEPMQIRGGAASATYQDVLKVPVSVENNRGLMGAGIELHYDTTLFTILSVTPGELWSKGLFDHDGDSAQGTLQVVWSGTEGCYYDGILFPVEFAVKGEAYGSYPMELRCNSAHTFNESYERLELPCKAATVTLKKADAQPLLYSGSYSAAIGEAVDVFLSIADNPGMAGGVLSLRYDAAALHFVEAQGLLLALDHVESEAGTLRISTKPLGKERGDGQLLRLTFRIKHCRVGSYTLEWSFDGGISCHPAQLSVQAGNGRIYGPRIQQTEPTVTVPVWIAGNPGLMGLKLHMTYDPAVLQLSSVDRSTLLSEGMFSHHLTREGSLFLVWSGTENMEEDGELFLLQFSVLKEIEEDTYITVSYSQADTFNSAWEDVILHCEEITLSPLSRELPCDGGTSCPGRGFADMPPVGNWAHEGIDFVVEQGLMVGVSNTKFAPKNPFTRAMMVMVLYRMEGSPEVEGSNSFTDVEQSAWYARAVTWASNAGVVQGYGDGTFQPNKPITREQIAVMFCRYAKLIQAYEEAEPSLSERFPDASTLSSWAEAEMNWAVATGLITGIATAEGSFLMPHRLASREQIATILLRFLSK